MDLDEVVFAPFVRLKRDVVIGAMVQVILLGIAPVAGRGTRGPIVEIIEVTVIRVIIEDREVEHMFCVQLWGPHSYIVRIWESSVVKRMFRLT